LSLLVAIMTALNVVLFLYFPDKKTLDIVAMIINGVAVIVFLRMQTMTIRQQYEEPELVLGRHYHLYKVVRPLGSRDNSRINGVLLGYYDKEIKGSRFAFFRNVSFSPEVDLSIDNSFVAINDQESGLILDLSLKPKKKHIA